jgi:hypothetical protein
MEGLMKKLFLALVISALLVPAAANAAKFTNLSGVVKGKATLTTTSFLNGDTGALVKTTTRLTGGTDHAIATGANEVLDFEDHILFNELGIVVTGNLLAVGKHKVAGSANFTLTSPAVTVVAPVGGTANRTVITGAAYVVGARNAKATNAVVNMTFQPGAVEFQTYTGTGTTDASVTSRTFGDAKIHLPAMTKAYSNRSSISLPEGF